MFQLTHARLRKFLHELLEEDRWIEGDFPTIAPYSVEEISFVIRKYSGTVMVVGNGTSFPPDFHPGDDVLILLTGMLKSICEISVADQVIAVSAGWSVLEVNEKLKEAGFCVPVLSCLSAGTIGGRLASISSRPRKGYGDGWVRSLLGLEVVLPSGEKINLGGRCIKDVAGYDMRHLFTGSRGAAGVITSAVFRCKPLDKNTACEESSPEYPHGEIHAEWRKLFDPDRRMRPGS